MLRLAVLLESAGAGQTAATDFDRRRSVSRISKISKFCKFLAGSFSAVSKRNFARKYAFDSIFQALQDLHPFAPLQSQNFRKKSYWKISNFRANDRANDAADAPAAVVASRGVAWRVPTFAASHRTKLYFLLKCILLVHHLLIYIFSSGFGRSSESSDTV